MSFVENCLPSVVWTLVKMCGMLLVVNVTGGLGHGWYNGHCQQPVSMPCFLQLFVLGVCSMYPAGDEYV